MGNHIIEKTDYGIYIRLSGRICKYDLQEWIEDIKPRMGRLKRNFNLIIDLRGIKPICHDTARTIGYWRAFLYGRGLRRTAVIFDTNATIIEMMKVFKEMGNDINERHISSTMNANWKEMAENWAAKGIEP